MKLNCYSKTDSLYIELRSATGVETREVAPDRVADFDADGHVVGFDIITRPSTSTFSTLGTVDLPLGVRKTA